MRLLPLVAALLLASPALAADAVLDALLPRLAEAERAREARSEGRTVTATTVAEELDGDGQVTSREETVERCTRRGDRSEGEVVRATRDGKDVTEEVRQKRREAEKQQKKRGAFASPFSAENQPHYQFAVVGKDAQGRLRVRISPREKREDFVEGEARVDAERGEVRVLEGRPAKLPTFAERAEFRAEVDAETPTGRDVSQLSVEGAGGFLFIKTSVVTPKPAKGGLLKTGQWREQVRRGSPGPV